MNILVLNGSPAGENSITLQTVEYIKSRFPEENFRVIHPGQRIRAMEKKFEECEQALNEADLLLFCYPVYTFLIPAQLHRFIELIKERGVKLAGKYATQISTSKHFFDVTAHSFIQENCDDLGLKYIRGLSADMEDLLTETGRKQAVDFFRFIRWNMQEGLREPVCAAQTAASPDAPVVRPGEPKAKRKPGVAVVVADLTGDTDGRLAAMIERFRNTFALETKLVDLAAFPFAGGCLGCFNCAADGKCIYKDGFDDYLRNNIQTADAIVYAFTVKDHSMGYRFKLYDDRQFCNGHRTVTMGKPVGYLVKGDLRREPNVSLLLRSRAEVGGNFLAGIAQSEINAEEEIDGLAKTLFYAMEQHYQPPADFYGVGGMKIFRDLIYQMQGMMKADHKFYKKNGFYNDYPQKHKGKIAAMYLVGGMMTNKKLKKKIGGKMTEGMLMPYKAALKKADKNKE